MATLSLNLVHAFCFTLLLNKVRTEIYTSVADAELLLETHESVIQSIEDYLQLQEEVVDILIDYLNLYEKEHEKMESNISNYVGNPLNMFTLIKRLTFDLESIENLTKSVEFVKKSDLVYPTREDLEGSATALARLENTYQLDIAQLANEILNGSFSHGKKEFIEETITASASDCFQVGHVLYVAKEWKRALEWFQQALDKLQNTEEVDISITEDSVVDFIRACYEELNDIDNALKWTKILISLQPNASETLNSKIKIYEDLKATQTISSKTEAKGKNNDTLKYEALCRGDIPVPVNKAKSLHCVYTSGPHPFLRLAPIKTEQLHLEPAVLMFYDVISDFEIQTVQKLAQPKLKRATTLKKGQVRDGEGVPSRFRISKSGWLKDDDDPTVARLTRRAADFTGLNMETAEQLQVGNYGIGGHYDLHFDYFSDYIPKNGNRIATVLFYMSDVEQGGATVLITLGVTVFPVKNSAIFWMNLLPSGEPDTRTEHAACPVLRGSEWVSNKWIHYVGQEFLAPCPVGYQ